MDAPESGTTEGGEVVVCREEGEERHEKGLHPGHIPYTLDIPRTVWWSEPSYVYRVHTHMQYTCYRSTTDSPPGLIDAC